MIQHDRASGASRFSAAKRGPSAAKSPTGKTTICPDAVGCFSLRGQCILLFLDGVVAFELGWGDVPQRGMAAVGVVVTDVRRQLPRRLGAVGVLDQFQLGLRPEEKTRGRSTTP